MNSNVLKGSILVAIGASCYGMMGTFVKLAYKAGFSVAEVTIAQFTLGFAALLLLSLVCKQAQKQDKRLPRPKSIAKLILAGPSLGLTSIFYYKAVQYVPVSTAIVLLMQAVWLGVIVEAVSERRFPGRAKLIAIAVVLTGTILAANIVNESPESHWLGILWGLASAIAYTATLYSSNHLETHVRPLQRSLYMILGGLISVCLFFHGALGGDFSFDIFLSWGLVIALFGTVVPPLLLTKGMPLTGVGFGAILAALEIPVSVLMGWMILGEQITALQWVGVVLILVAIVVMNAGQKNRKSQV